MDKHKLKDFIDATKEEAGNVAVEEVLPAVVKEAGGFIVSEGVGILYLNHYKRKEVITYAQNERQQKPSQNQ